MIYKRKNDEIKTSTFFRGLLLGTLIIAIALLGYTIQQKGILADEGISFQIEDQLGPNQIEETIHVYINDKYVGTLQIDTQNPVDTLEVTVPKDGIFSYRVESETHLSTRQISIHGEGGGTMNISEGDSFSAYYQTTGNPNQWTISLWEYTR